MWAVVTTVQVPEGADPAELRAALEHDALPLARKAPGFVHGYWTLSPDHRSGVGFVLYADADGARARAAQVEVGGAGPGGATIISAEVFEVLADG